MRQIQSFRFPFRYRQKYLYVISHKVLVVKYVNKNFDQCYSLTFAPDFKFHYEIFRYRLMKLLVLI